VWGVLSTTAGEDSVPEQFFDDFGSVLAKHRAWDRETDSVPALIAMWPV
jgi:catalase